MLWLAALLIVSLVAAACGDDDDDTEAGQGDTTETTAAARQPQGEPIILGIQTDQTGPGAAYNVPATEVIKALVEVQNNKGGLLGRPIRVVEGNDESDPTKAPTVLRQIVDQKAVFLFHHSGSSALIQTKPLTKELRLPTIASTHSGNVVPNPPDNDFIFTLGLPTTSWANVYCAGMENAGIKKLALLLDDTPTIAAFSKGILDNMPCVEIVARETAPVNATDLSAQIARLKDSDPDAVLTFSQGTTFEITAQNALYEQMADVPRFMTATLGNTPDAWKVVNAGALDGVVFMATIDPENKVSKDVEAEMKDLIGDDFALTQFTGQTYDAFHLFVQAVEKAGSTEPDAIKQALESTSGYKASFGSPGTTLSWRPDKHIAADSECALLLVAFGPDNEPAGPWENFEPQC
jgi:branched-chain amino acid transport system substrate-binding protein